MADGLLGVVVVEGVERHRQAGIEEANFAVSAPTARDALAVQ